MAAGPRLGALAAAHPARTARLLLRPANRQLLERGARQLGDGVLVRLARTAPDGLVVELGRAMAQDSAGLARLLAALPPGRRTALHASVTAGRGPGGPAVDAVLLDALPRSGVTDEARRMAARAAERGEDWHTVLLAESYLPAAEVWDRLLAATRRPAAADRALVWPLLVRNAGRTGASGPVAVLLDDMARLRNEQDPVRSAALRALAAVPAHLFTEAMEPALDRLTADAVEARDSSHATRHALSTLAVRLLREHAVTGRRALVSWPLRTLVRISGSTGGADLGRLDHTLRRGQSTTSSRPCGPGWRPVRRRATTGWSSPSPGRWAAALPGCPNSRTCCGRRSATARSPPPGPPSGCGWNRPRTGAGAWSGCSRSTRRPARCPKCCGSSPTAAPTSSTRTWRPRRPTAAS